MNTAKITKKIILIVLPLLAIAGISFGLYQWQFNPDSIKDQLQTNSTHDSLEDYYNTAQGLSPVEQKTEVSFFAVGDIMLSRIVAKRIFQNNLDSFWPFRALENELLSTDFNFGNLESPFSKSDQYLNEDQFIFNAPSWAMPGLAQHNFKVLSLANNHSFDQGSAGILHTQNLLKDNFLTAVGVGESLKDAWQGQVYSTKGLRVGFIGATYGTNKADYSGNISVANIKDISNLKNSILELKTRSDFIVVSMHAGTEYQREPNKAQQNFARAAIDAGADLVIGHHPHWIQTIEQYNGKYIFYSLGNFVFDQMWSQDTREGLMIKINLEKDGVCATDPRLSPSKQQQVTCGDNIQGSNLPATVKQIELVPVIIENYGQPRLANETEKQLILKKIGATTNVITPQ